MTKIVADWLTSEASNRVMGMLKTAGFEAYFVGGCVRSALLDMGVSDLDVATSAHPDVVMTLAKDAGLKVIPTGVDHGTVTVIVDNQPYEITTFRKDIETDGRRAVVAFSDRLEEDAERRDFTINALYATADGQVIDPVGGIPDLRARLVRFINDPHQRIREDYLRILRFFRFYAWVGDPDRGLDPDGLAACAANLDGLDGLAKERVQTEILKTLLAPNPAPAMSAMAMSGVLHRLLPGADVSALAPLVHLEGEMNRPAHLHTRLAAINPGDVDAALRLSRADTLEFNRIRDGATQGVAALQLGYALGGQAAIEALMLRAAMMGQTVSQDDLDAALLGGGQVFPIKAQDLMPSYQGPALGARLKDLEAAWIESDFALTKDALLNLS